MKVRFAAILTCTAIAAGLAPAAPEPAIVQVPGDWTLVTGFEHPQQIVLPLGQDRSVRFWYTIVTVTNQTGQDVEFYPQADLMTDTFQIVPAGKGVAPVVFEAIKARHKDKYPFLEPFDTADNRILEGADNTKDLAVIWQDFDAQADGFIVFITGLSNETAAIPHPLAKDDQGRPIPVYLRKTLELTYSFEGDPAMRASVRTLYKGKRWVMR